MIRSISGHCISQVANRCQLNVRLQTNATNSSAALGHRGPLRHPPGFPLPHPGPTPLWRTVFCWIALLPLLWALLGNDKSGKPLTLRQGAALGYICGFVWYMGNCYWIYQTMYLYGGLAKPIAAGILVLFCLYLGLYHALFGTLLAAFRNRFGRQ